MTQDMNHTFGKALRAVLVAAMMSLTGNQALAQEDPQTPTSTSTGVVVNGNVFGGGNLAEVKGRVTVNIKAGTVVNDVYGGGAKANTNSSINTIDTTDPDNPIYPTTVNLTGGTIGNAYGGGLGEKAGVNGGTEDKEALVYGDVLVNVNGTAFTQEFDTYQEGTGEAATTVKVPKTGRVFGCNNLNGSPKKTVTVHVHKTVRLDGGDHVEGDYEIAAVYGGGNEAAYEPTIANPNAETDANHAHTNVIVDGCSLTSIKQVYGGGNAASTPSTQVTINGAFEIDEVFGGGNGNDMIKRTSGSDVSWEVNSGANVGFYAYDADSEDYDTPEERAAMAYGFGKAKVNINGGIIHYVYGGSNAKGNVRQVAVAMLEKTSDEDCFTVDEAYGGGKAAPMDGRAELQLGCIPGVGTVYGGARAATVNNDVVLTITNGTYNNVFGGNNEKGTINGSITINVEETGCRPIHIGNLYGGGNLAPYTTPSGKNGPTINIKSFTSIDHVYGGGFGAGANVTGDVTVNINEVKGRWSQANTTVEANSYNETGAATIGVIGDVYGGGYGADVVGDVKVNIGTAETVGFVTEPTYLGEGKYSYNSTTKLYDTNVVGAIITGNVFGGGFGARTTVTGDVAVNIGGQKTVEGQVQYIGNITIGGSTDGGNVYGGSALGAVNAAWDADDDTKLNPTANATTSVTLKKGNIAGAVFGGGKGEAGTSSGARAVDGKLGDPAPSGTEAQVYGNTTVTLYGDVVAGGLYGGCDVNGRLHGNTELNLYGGTVGTALAEGESAPDIVFGGGLGKATTVDGDVTVNVGNATNAGTTIYSNVYGGSAEGTVNSSASNTTTVNLFKGIIHGDVFGGGKGVAGQEAKAAVGTEGEPGYQPAVPAITPIPAYVKGCVRVNLNGYAGMDLEDEDAFGTCVVTGNIFGCNNANGSPEGDVEVHIYKTIGIGSNVRSTDKDNSTFDLAAVYGGGNEAAYTASGKTANVVIETCDVSVETVYGGGNAAKVPATRVDVNGAWEIGTVFGGGNGADNLSNGDPNPGADVDGTTYVSLQLGTIHEAYGGSNTKGVIQHGSTMDVNDNNAGSSDENACHLKVDKVYGGGKNAGMKGGTNIILRCQPDEWVEEIYAGSQMADVEGDVSLTITSGKFERVFGGNKTSGKIYGSITVNIEETGTCGTPIVIGELYGGGYQAKYSIYGYNENGSPRTKAQYESLKAQIVGKTDAEIEASDELKAIKEELTGLPYKQPQLNVRSFTSIGAIYGGGFEADMVADPTVSINVVEGSLNNDATIHTGTNDTYPATTPTTPFNNLPYPVHTKGSIGVIGNVFGGGNLAEVDGSATVNIGTESKVEMISLPKVDAVEGDPEYNSEAANQVKVYQKKTVLGANITGNVYGGGNEAGVTGDTQVNICVKKNTSNAYENVDPGTAGVSIGGDVFGAGKGKDDDVKKALVQGNSFVKMGGGSVIGNIYGGGEMSSVGGFTYNTDDIVTGCADNTGTATVNISGGTVGDSGEYAYDANNKLSHTNGGNVFAGGKGVLKKSDNSYLTNWIKFAKVKNTVLTVSGTDTRIMSNIYGGGEIGTVGYETGSGSSKTLVGGTSIEITGGTIGTEIKNGSNVTQYTFGSVYGGGYGNTTESTTDATDPNAPKLFAGRVYGSTSVTMSAGAVKASIYGGGEVASVSGSATVTVSGGSVGIPKVNGKQFGGATMGNVYGGGNGNKNIVRAGQIFGNTTVSISQADDNIPTYIYHNVYGGGAYGTVGDFEYSYTYEAPGFEGIAKVNGIDHLISGGTATVTITGGTIGVDGKENGMVFGSSRGDVGAPQSRDDYLAWVNDANVVIGTSGVTTGPQIYGSLYGSGENGHTFNDANVTLHSGTIGVTTASDATNITEDGTTYYGAAYPKRGNVYGGGCGTDMYDSDNDGTEDSYNPLAGIVYGDATVTITGGQVAHNVYGAGAMGSVGTITKDDAGVVTIASGTGTTTIAISGGIIGVSGTVGDGNVYGAARGDKEFTDKDLALVNTTRVTVSGTTQIKGNVYGGGEVGNVQADTRVNIQGGAIAGNVYGGGKGVEDLFTCEQAMVGVEGEGAGADLTSNDNKDKGTIVTISNGTVGTLSNAGVLVDGTGNVYGGGEIGRVEWNTQVKIGVGTGDGTFAPTIYGNVFGAGKGLKTHGYSALVRGNSTVTIQGGAKIGENVYGGGEMSTVGRYWVKNINNNVEGAPTAPTDLPDGMPYQKQSGGICHVTIQGSAEIGTNGTDDKGHVFGAGKGVDLPYNASTSKKKIGNNDLVPFTNEIDENSHEIIKTAEQLYYEFLQTLALVTETYVTIDGSAQVKGSVFGGSESGFVQANTDVKIQGSGCVIGTTKYGNVFGGGKGLEYFAEAGKVKGNTTIAVSAGTIKGNIYGGGRLGDVGIITKPANYNYTWKQNDGTTANVANHNTNATATNTGICTVTISGGTIGLSSTSEPTKHGNVFGAGRGSSTTWWCEKAIAYATNVSVTAGTVNGNVYGGGEVGRVEDDTKVTIGSTNSLTITGSVFGAGAGLKTHGYSALVRGNAEVTVQGIAQVGGSVYGGGEIASVGRFHVVGGLPRNPQAGGTCTVKIQGEAKIGTSGTAGHNVFGACKGVTPVYDNTQGSTDRSKSMQLEANRPKVKDPVTGEDTETVKPEHEFWDYCETYPEGYAGTKFVWVYYETEEDYLDFLKTLALTSNTHVTVGGSSSVYGSVYGGGERGITLGGVDVNMTGGMVNEDVYGGGSLADSNTAMWDATSNTPHDYAKLELIPGLSDVTGYYTAKSPDALIETPNAKAKEGTTYYAIYKTNVSLTGGTINGNAYGGGLGRKEYGTSGQDGYVSPIEAMVYGDVLVELNKGIAEDETAKGCAVTRVFGCNNLNGTPKGKVKVYVYATQKKGGTSILNTQRGTYDVEAVYGGGNLAAYIPYDATLDYTVTANQTKVDEAYAEVIIDGCKVTSIRQVYGGGNAAPVPASHVEIRRAYEIDEVFGGGNGADNYSLKEGNTDVWYQNPGANVGYYNYTTTTTSGSKPGSISSPYYLAPDDVAFDTKDERLADNTAAAALRYGSGIARLEVKGGTIHTSYGGSNSRGNIRVKASSVYSASFDDCPMSVEKSYGGGKNAPIDGEVDMVADCAKGIKQMFGGSENADVDNDINLVITNGSSLERVFGGNNTSGAINGSITVTIEEGGCEPIKIGHLYLGGFLAPYSVYGYEKNEDGSYKTESVDYVDTDGTTKSRLQRIPLESGSERKADPRIIVISATRIDSIFGGGYQAKLVGNPHVNVNMTNGFVKVTKTEKEATDENTYAYEYTENGKTYIYKDASGTVYSNEGLVTTTGENTFLKPLEIGTIGTIYGGGNMADIVGDTYVEIGTGTCHNENGELVDINRNAATITGNVFGGGKGKADSFKCAKAMVGKEDSGSGSTSVIIGNGTIEGTVYGGGEIGRVEANTNVTIGLAEDDVPDGLTSLPVIKGNVFGAGRGVHTHGYAALVRGNATVTVQGEAKVRKSVYGGGEIASVGKYNIADAAYHNAHPEVLEGMPYSLVSDNRGICNVTVKDNAVIGPEGSMEMKKATGGPDDIGHVFGAGKGVLPYQDIDGKDITKNNTVDPWRMKPGDIVETFNETTFSDAYYTDLYGSGYDKKLYNYLADYLRFIETLALTTQTEVTIGGNAFVKGSVYGGSENGHVQHNTHVTIQDDCQIGHSKGVSTRFTEDQWRNEVADIKPCASWDYDAADGAPYDPLAEQDGTYDYTNYQFVPAADRSSRPNSDGGKPTATDGHTFYGNVFGGGSGLIPYAPGKWHRNAGSVGGNTVVDISGGHIMTSVYGGNEQTDVGTYELDKDNGYQPTIPKDGGKCTINMTGGTVGVPRTKEQIEALPVICNVFGAGKGDQRIFFNTWTNVINTEVNISGTARIYGSTFGGGEDGHVMNNAVTNISGDNEKVIIGSVGTSYMDGNVFGGGRGFSGEAQTAGTVGGNVTLKISGGHILGSVYGGGRLASVGTLFTAPEHPNYGNFQEDGDGKTYGHVNVEISGSAIIGNSVGNRESGNVFGGSMGRLKLLDNTNINPLWPRMAQVKTSTVAVKGDAVIRRNVYGGGELGTVRDHAVVTISGGTVRRDVYGGGYGSDDFDTKTTIHVKEPTVENPDPTNPDHYKIVDYKFTPMIFAGCVGQSTTVNVNGGWIRKSVYGGGEMASVGIIDCRVDADGNYLYFHEHSDAENGFVLSWPYHFEYTPGYGGAAQVNVTGGRIGVIEGQNNNDIGTDNGDVYGAGKGIAGDYKTYIYCANVGSAEVNINYTSSETTLDPKTYETSGDCITGAVYGGGENGHVMGDAKLTLQNGLVGHSIYGGGSGKGKFTKWLTKIPEARRSVVTSGGTGTAPNTNANGEYEAECYSITAGKVFGNTRIDMSGGYVIRNVYGGGNMASVGKGNYSGGLDDYSSAGYGETLSGNLWDGGSQFSQAFLNSGKCTVNITGGTVGYIGNDPLDPLKFVYPRDYNTGLPYGNVFGGCRGESAPNILESPRYLYCPEFFLGYVNETDVTIGQSDGTGPAILGSVYGGGMDGHVRRDTKVTINGGTIGSEYTSAECNKVGTSDLNNIMWQHRGNVYGAGSGIGKYKFDLNYDGDFGDVIDYTTPTTPSRTTRLKEEDFSTSAGSVTRFTTVTINGGTIHRNVYGGGSLASVGGPKIPPILTDPIRRDDQATATQGKQSLNQVVIAGGQIGDASSYDAAGNHVYGGYVFGASRGEATIENPSSFAQAVWTDVDIKPHATDPNKPVIYADVYGGGEVGSVRQGVKVDLTGGKVGHDVFGGGRGTSAVAADIGGDVTVDVNNVAEDAKGCIVLGNIYGANNVNGTPLGHVLVHVHATQNKDEADVSTKSTLANVYDVAAVFGGGKSADYVPADTKQSTEVIIEGCNLTSIQEVYGGGYGAAVPATSVLIKGTKIIDNVYGGGYGAGTDNPGANIGYYTNSDPTSTNKVSYLSGSGMAVVQLMAGKVNNVYGGSNTKGDIRERSNVTTVDKTNDPGCCDKLEVQEIYGGGKQAPMEGGAEIVLGCMPDDWIGEIYAGAREANVGNDVSLTITSGKFERVFGGNRSSGEIDGYVEVNIEECPTCGKPGIIIGELYGGGNLAPYTVPESYGKDYQSPRVNVRAFTSIGTIYGGGFGAGAVVTGNPTVNINVGMVQGGGQNFDGIDEKSLDDQTTVKLYPHEAGKIGVIGNVFGGGNAAPVEGSTTVNIGTKEYEVLAGVIPGETDVTGYYVRSGEAPNYVYTLVEPEAPATPEASVAPVIAQDNTVYCILVKGVDIRGNVYGGGNNAGVTGDTNVVIGKSK